MFVSFAAITLVDQLPVQRREPRGCRAGGKRKLAWHGQRWFSSPVVPDLSLLTAFRVALISVDCLFQPASSGLW